MGDQAKSAGGLEARLKSGRFVLTAETSPPDAAALEPVLARAACLKGLVDAVNVTDGAGAKAHMSALAAAAILARAGIEPVLQLTARDRNRMALQADMLGAAALGVPNLLCLKGDDPAKGDQPETKPVFDLDGRGLIETARLLRDEGRFPSGRKIEPAPRFLIGATDAPVEPGAGWKPVALAAKIEAGADFVQTQFCFDMGLLRRYLAALGDHGLAARVPILVGIGPLASGRAARWMREKLPGVQLPEALVDRLERAADPAAEGRRICAELLEELAEIEGVAGAHLMAPGREAAIAETLQIAAFRDRPRAAAGGI
ncbi:MAG: methylenetetrahydrofolate reductase [Pseudomonadota bacterium]